MQKIVHRTTIDGVAGGLPKRIEVTKLKKIGSSVLVFRGKLGEDNGMSREVEIGKQFNLRSTTKLSLLKSSLLYTKARKSLLRDIRRTQKRLKSSIVR